MEYIKTYGNVRFIFTFFKYLIIIIIIYFAFSLLVSFVWGFQLSETINNDYKSFLTLLNYSFEIFQSYKKKMYNFIYDKFSSFIALSIVIFPIIKSKIWNNDYWSIKFYEHKHTFEILIFNLSKKANLFYISKMYVSNGDNSNYEFPFKKYDFLNFLSKEFLVKGESTESLIIKKKILRKILKECNYLIYYEKYNFRRDYYSKIIVNRIRDQINNNISNIGYNTYLFKLNSKYKSELTQILNSKFTNTDKVKRLEDYGIIDKNQIAVFIIHEKIFSKNIKYFTITVEFKCKKKAIIQSNLTKKFTITTKILKKNIF